MTDVLGRFAFLSVPTGLELTITAADRDGVDGAWAPIAPVSASARTQLIGHLQFTGTGNGNCGGFEGFRDSSPATYVWPHVAAVRRFFCF